MEMFTFLEENNKSKKKKVSVSSTIEINLV